MTNTTTYGSARLSKPMARALVLATEAGGLYVTANRQDQRTLEALAKRGLMDYGVSAGPGVASYLVNDKGLDQAVELESVFYELV